MLCTLLFEIEILKCSEEHHLFHIVIMLSLFEIKGGTNLRLHKQ